jgi:hypothetical protein
LFNIENDQSSTPLSPGPAREKTTLNLLLFATHYGAVNTSGYVEARKQSIDFGSWWYNMAASSIMR